MVILILYCVRTQATSWPSGLQREALTLLRRPAPRRPPLTPRVACRPAVTPWSPRPAGESSPLGSAAGAWPGRCWAPPWASHGPAPAETCSWRPACSTVRVGQGQVTVSTECGQSKG